MRAGPRARASAAALAIMIGLAGCGAQFDGADPPARDAAPNSDAGTGSAVGVQAQEHAQEITQADMQERAAARAPASATRADPRPPARSAGRHWRVVCGQGGPGLQSVIDAAASGDTIRVIGDCDEAGVVDGKDLSIEREPRAGPASEAASEATSAAADG